MNNEGETRGETSEVTSDLFNNEYLPQFQKFEGCDASPVASSRYSSCGESEFERYCSANSVMGTPSVCSSMGAFHECMESEFGSVKCFDVGESDALEGFSLCGRSPRNFQNKRFSLSVESSCWDSQNDVFSNGKDAEEATNIEGLVGFDAGLQFDDNAYYSFSGEMPHGGTNDKRLSRSSDGVDEKEIDRINDSREVNSESHTENSEFLSSTVENVLKQRALDSQSSDANFIHEPNHLVHNSVGVLLPQPAQVIDERDCERCTEQDEASSKDEHSEGEDSMFNYGSDEENSPTVYYARNLHGCHEVYEESGNLVLMNTSSAFGSNDWEDFELERVGTDSAPPMLGESQECQERNIEIKITPPDLSSRRPGHYNNFDIQEQEKGSIDVSIVNDQVEGVDGPSECPISCLETFTDSSRFGESVGDETDIAVSRKQVLDAETEAYGQGYSVHNAFVKQDSWKQPELQGMESMDGVREKELLCVSDNEAISDDDQQLLKSQKLCKLQQQLDLFPDTMHIHASFPSKDVFEDFPTKDVLEDEGMVFSEDYKLSSVSSTSESNEGRIQNDMNLVEDTKKGRNFEMNALYDEVVHEMEEILLESANSPVGRLNSSSVMFNSQQPLPIDDDGSSSSASVLNNDYLQNSQPVRLDGIEVVGAKQKKGDISFSERLVGVKEHTVYVIRVWSGKNKWDIERRYRDFYTLYRQLKYLFTERGWILPSPWSSVEQESRKIFSNASPDVISERSVLIQECLCSIINSRHSSGALSSLIWFLSPPNSLLSSSLSNVVVHQSTTAADAENISTLGKTISLVLELQPLKLAKQLLEEQHYTCAGCHKHFVDGKSRVKEFVQAFGWGKPRFCEYTGQLFCSSCHTNDTAVLPARVLHHWDFTEHPVSQLAKSYLDSIIDQPMLCVSAVNPLLFSKVPALLSVVSIRKKIGAMLAYVQCPFRRSLYRGLRSRRYLLESNDFFALRDLIDLSKGAFAALPVILETVLKKIHEHITEQCLVCCDVGVPCAARQACDDPSSLIFPFQDEDIERCESCKSVFHKHCFTRLTKCPCGMHLKSDDGTDSMSEPSLGAGGNAEGDLSLLRKKSHTVTAEGFLPRLFSTGRPGKTRGHLEGDTVILMGSLPSTSI
ncbi:hypothetical protein Nepgr_025251 [Nepenthes gracilis]|uniref:PX domain-containing protein n=1 Tax=Nepenthes gracilis TaxID=150966 RepID=A0AAD3T5S2_NEPGR|nr:hypothetical protein Nepgr_025251 [Nepenthes gracilis]